MLISVKESQQTMIRCEVSGDPVPTVTWEFDGVNIEDLASESKLD